MTYIIPILRRLCGPESDRKPTLGFKSTKTGRRIKLVFTSSTPIVYIVKYPPTYVYYFQAAEFTFCELKVSLFYFIFMTRTNDKIMKSAK